MEQIKNDSDIQSTEDVALLINKFYSFATIDPLIGIFFTEVVKVNWETHTPLIISFWDSILFGRGTYSGNVMEKHVNIHYLKNIEPIHFERWLMLWEATIRSMFTGPKADEAISRAKNIIAIMQHQLS